jgi:hypothetical protein
LIAKNSEISIDQDQVARVAGDRPQRGVAVEMQDERVDDLLGPVHQPERESCEHDAPGRLLDLDRLHVHGEREQRDRRPVELTVGAEHSLRVARE